MAHSQTMISEHHLDQRLVRFDDMVPCKTAFIDARTPGSDKKENFCLIGNGVAENPDQVVHITIPHGFNIGAARQPHGCKNSHHSHDTEEVFMIFSGHWKFTWGEQGEDGNIVLTAGDTISLPRHMFRGFENVGDDGAFMFSILGLNEAGSAGHVLWAPYVFAEAKNHGLVLLEDGRLIDTAAGKRIPADGKPQKATTVAQAASLSRLSRDEMIRCVAKQEELDTLSSGGLSQFQGVTEIAVIGPANSLEDMPAGKMNWSHGFQMRRLILQASARVPTHCRAEEEVIIVLSGSMRIRCDEQDLMLNAGDLITVPIGSQREFSNPGSQQIDLIVVRRGNQPQAADFCDSN